MKPIVIASHNPAKVRWYRELFAPFCEKVLGLDEVDGIEKPIESGTTAEENAEIKAKYYASFTEHIVFAEDEALYVDFLPVDQQPGVHVRRIAGKEEASDGQLLIHWEQMIANVPVDQRTGKWHTAYSIAFPDQTVKTLALDYPIRFYAPSSPVRIPGWPMSSLEGPLEIGKPYSEMTDAEKYSNRERADRLILAALAEMLP